MFARPAKGGGVVSPAFVVLMVVFVVVLSALPIRGPVRAS